MRQRGESFNRKQRERMHTWNGARVVHADKSRTVHGGRYDTDNSAPVPGSQIAWSLDGQAIAAQGVHIHACYEGYPVTVSWLAHSCGLIIYGSTRQFVSKGDSSLMVAPLNNSILMLYSAGGVMVVTLEYHEFIATEDGEHLLTEDGIPLEMDL